MTHAEATVKFAILSAISAEWEKKDPEALRDAIFNNLFKPEFRWAIELYLEELKEKE